MRTMGSESLIHKKSVTLCFAGGCKIFWACQDISSHCHIFVFFQPQIIGGMQDSDFNTQQPINFSEVGIQG